MNVSAKGEDTLDEQASVHTANMEFAPTWDDDASVLQNDDVEANDDEAEEKVELPIRLIPGYATFNDYLQVCLLFVLPPSPPTLLSMSLH